MLGDVAVMIGTPWDWEGVGVSVLAPAASLLAPATVSAKGNAVRELFTVPAELDEAADCSFLGSLDTRSSSSA